MTSMWISCFLAAADTLNFTTAAQKVHITQPAFSRNIAAMEEELGFPLFIRNKQSGLRITPAGLIVYDGLKHMVSEYESIKNQARRVDRGEEGKLVISILMGCCMDSPTFQAIQNFHEKYPNVEIVPKSVTFQQLLRSVREGWSDICFSIMDVLEPDSEFLVEPVYEIDSYLVVPSSLGCHSDQIYQIADFRDQCFLLSEDAPEINRAFVQVCRDAGFEPYTAMAPDYETKMLWAEAGRGVAANNKDHSMRTSPHVDFVRVRELKPLSYSIIWDKSNHNPAIAMFYSTLDETKYFV